MSNKLSLLEDNTGAGKVLETELKALTIKKKNSEKAKTGLGTSRQKVPSSEKAKGGLGALIGARAVEVRRIVVDLAMVKPGTMKAEPGEPMDMEPRKKARQ